MKKNNILESISTALFITLISIMPLFGQEFSQTIRGKVVDQINQQQLAGAEVKVANLEKKFSTYTDENGAFRLDNVPAGRHTLMINIEGYETYFIPDLEVNAGKEKVLEISLKTQLYELEEVVINSENSRQLDKISTTTFTVEETQRYAATYYDPARLMTAYPGVGTANDQANHIVVRGNSPNGILWRMEGVDIVNPNHTPNAGTFSDRVSSSGGGVIILSTQLLDNSSFMTGAFSPQYGNALSGIFDIQLRKGNNENYEFTGQAGLIGIDLAVEGPISRENGSSFLANYRYSTVGLLSLMGVPLGDEEITYQDFAFNLNIPTKNAGTFTFFGMGGLSNNIFAAERDSSVWEFQKDRFDINFASDMGAIGATHTLLIGTKSLLKTVVAASALKSTRNAEFLNSQFSLQPAEEDVLNQSKVSATTSFSHRFNNRSTLRVGLFYNHIGYEINSVNTTLEANPRRDIIASAKGNMQLVQPYLSWNYWLSDKLNLKAGLHGMFLDLNQTKAIEPRASLKYQISNENSLSLAYGLHSQLQLPGTYFATAELADGSLAFPNKELGFTKAHHLVMSYSHLLGENLSLKIEPYYQYLFNVPIVNDPNSTFSTLNLVEGYVTDSLVNEGTGENYGVEFSVEKILSNDYYFLVSGSLYDSKYIAGDGIKRDTRYNGKYLFTLSGGKEIHKTTSRGKNKTWGLNARFIYQGGYRDTPIDALASAAQRRTVYAESEAFSQKMLDYYRLDLRVSFKRNKKKVTRVFAIDIQNATNRQNVAFQYYDFLKSEIVNKYQLGIIPLLSYRLEF